MSLDTYFVTLASDPETMLIVDALWNLSEVSPLCKLTTYYDE
jgi:hypothetical protein